LAIIFTSHPAISILIEFIIRDGEVTVIVDTVAKFHGAGVPRRIVVVTVVGTEEGTIAVGINLVARDVTVAVGILAVADLQGAGVDVDVGIVTVDGTADPAIGGITVPVEIGCHTGHTNREGGTGSIGTIRLVVTVVVYAVVTDLRGAGVDRGIRVVAVGPAADRIGKTVAVGIGTGTTRFINQTVTVIVPAVAADFHVAREASRVIVITVTGTEGNTVTVGVTLIEGKFVVTVVIDPVAEFRGSGITVRIVVVAVTGAEEGPVTVGVDFVARRIAVAVGVLPVTGLQSAGINVGVGVVAVNGAAITAVGRVGIPVQVGIDTNLTVGIASTSGNILTVGQIVTIIVDPVVTDLRGTGIDIGIGVVTVGPAADGKLESVTVLVRTDTSFRIGGIDSTVTVIVDPIAADLHVTGKTAGIVVVTVALTKGNPVLVRIALIKGKFVITIVILPVTDLGVSGEPGRVRVVTVVQIPSRTIRRGRIAVTVSVQVGTDGKGRRCPHSEDEEGTEEDPE